MHEFMISNEIYANASQENSPVNYVDGREGGDDRNVKPLGIVHWRPKHCHRAPLHLLIH